MNALLGEAGVLGIKKEIGSTGTKCDRVTIYEDYLYNLLRFHKM